MHKIYFTFIKIATSCLCLTNLEGDLFPHQSKLLRQGYSTYRGLSDKELLDFALLKCCYINLQILQISKLDVLVLYSSI